ncbi:hypothetical protein [Acetobacterium bakii]|uniref:Uncharacterized protein n=1 Tax=Acetobacterium bakii TaxID=52689 RepID=A0A0L6TVR5_9FIRM|nr:hypothetical protein [Acetobacterium bakii]KNZ40344.1 hypothetical protein AKG39_18315 [Acetobacterium bakii]
MKNSVLYPMAIAIMIVALLCMTLNLTVVSFPDWAIRITGIVMLADLAVLSFLTARSKKGKN